MKYVKSYQVHPSGSGRITTFERATPFAVMLDGDNLRVFLAVDDSLPTQARNIYVLEDEQAFEPKGPVKYLGTVLVPGLYETTVDQQTVETRAPKYLHVLIDDPRPPQSVREVAMSELPPEMQDQIKRQIEAAQKQPGQESPPGA